MSFRKRLHRLMSASVPVSAGALLLAVGLSGCMTSPNARLALSAGAVAADVVAADAENPYVRAGAAAAGAAARELAR